MYRVAGRSIRFLNLTSIHFQELLEALGAYLSSFSSFIVSSMRRPYFTAICMDCFSLNGRICCVWERWAKLITRLCNHLTSSELTGIDLASRLRAWNGRTADWLGSHSDPWWEWFYQEGRSFSGSCPAMEMGGWVRWTIARGGCISGIGFVIRHLNPIYIFSTYRCSM